MTRADAQSFSRRGMRNVAAAALGLAMVGIAGCGGSSQNPDSITAPPEPAPATSQGALAPGGGLSVEEAVEADADDVLTVRGALVIAEGAPPRLCAALAESFPPQCGEPSLVIEGLDLASIDTLQSEGAVSWSESVQVLGTVQAGVLTVSTTSM